MNYNALSLNELKAELTKQQNIMNVKSAEQHALKILLNSLFGITANRWFNFCDINLAKAITLTGQMVIKWSEKHVNLYLNKILETKNVDYIIYVDTDSVVGSTKIIVNNKEISIEDYYNSVEGLLEIRGKNNYIKHLPNKSNDLCLSYSGNKQQTENNRINYIMKHKVKKRMFKIEFNNNSVVVTEDHSVVVIRDDETISISPINILKTDKLISIVDILQKRTLIGTNFKIKDIGVCEDWVYDIEVEENHNFFANNILVHNSIYVNMEKIVELSIPNETDVNKITDFLDKVCKLIEKNCLKPAYLKLFKKLNCRENLMKMDREVISSKGGFFIACKKYSILVDDDEGVRCIPPKLKVIGLEIVKKDTPEVIRVELKKIVSMILETHDNEKLINEIERFETDFLINKKYSYNELAKTKSVNFIKKYQTTNSLYDKGTPQNSRAAILYNDLLDKHNIISREKIKEGNKIKIINLKLPNTLNENVIGYVGSIPEEFGLIKYVDYETTYEKSFMSPLNKIFDGIGWKTEQPATFDAFY